MKLSDFNEVDFLFIYQDAINVFAKIGLGCFSHMRQNMNKKGLGIKRNALLLDDKGQFLVPKPIKNRLLGFLE